MYFIYDTETNGISTKANHYFSIISLGFVVLDEDLAMMDKGYILLNRKDIPMNQWDKRAMAVHGISQHKSIKEGERLEDGLREIKEMMDTLPIHVAHNYSFDRSAINATYSLAGMDAPLTPETSICTMNMAQARLPKKGLKYTWETLREKGWIKSKRSFQQAFKHHNAQDDARACGHILIGFDRMDKRKGIQQGRQLKIT